MAQATLELINQSVRDRFELSWLRQAPETIEAMLPDPSADGYLPTLEELVRIDFEKSWRRAERDGSNPPALEGYLDRFPMLRQPDRLVRLLVKEQEMRSAAGGGAADSTIASVPIAERFPELAGDATAQALQDTVVDTLRDPAAETLAYGVWDRPKLPELGDFGEYELLGRLGAGGMGVVYRARQKVAEREVALKVVHAERQGSKSRDSQSKVVDRFRTEAKAAAQLQHENIVPVYDVGEVGDKLYFSMQLVEGESLSDMVDAGPLEPRRAAAYLRGVAQGIQAAHDRGILHRDLKPHNVMIDRRNDRPLVADFGLAKVVEADDQLTRSGEVIGTPSYMAPEQVSSAAGVDAAADLYALGATLYHLLTGRPPFKGPNTMATLRQVLFQEVVEPRQLNAAIDRDLNTICVKCLQKDASRRYRSAAELADDLGRYLEGRPIAARPVGPTERAARWCRRNPLAASMLGLAGVMAGLVFASVLVGYRQTTAALAVAEHNYELARDSVDTLYTDVSQIDLENAPGMQPLKQKLLRRSLGYYQRLLDGPAGDGRAGDAELTTELAGNHFRVGSILADLGEAANAVGHLQTAADIQSDLLADRPDDAELRLARSDSLNKLARAQLRRGDAEAARASFGEAKEIRSRLVEQRPGDRELRRKLASVEMNLGLLAARGGDYVSARESYDAAQAVRLELLKEEETPDVARDLAKGSFNLGVLHGREGRFAEAAAALRQAIARYESLLAVEPESLAHRFSLGVAQFLLADMLRLAGDQPLATAAFDAAEANLRVLVDENPKVVAYQQELSRQQIGRAQLEIEQGQGEAQQAADDPSRLAASQRHYERAERSLAAAEQRLATLVERNPSMVDYRYDLSVVRQMLGDIRLAFSDAEAARGLFTAALANIASQPDDGDFAELRRGIQTSLDALGDADVTGEEGL